MVSRCFKYFLPPKKWIEMGWSPKCWAWNCETTKLQRHRRVRLANLLCQVPFGHRLPWKGPWLMSYPCASKRNIRETSGSEECSKRDRLKIVSLIYIINTCRNKKPLENYDPFSLSLMLSLFQQLTRPESDYKLTAKRLVNSSQCNVGAHPRTTGWGRYHQSSI